jgi:hypothetical protein
MVNNLRNIIYTTKYGIATDIIETVVKFFSASNYNSSYFPSPPPLSPYRGLRAKGKRFNELVEASERHRSVLGTGQSGHPHGPHYGLLDENGEPPLYRTPPRELQHVYFLFFGHYLLIIIN